MSYVSGVLAPKCVARLLWPIALVALCAGAPPRYADRLKQFEAAAAAKKKELGLSQAELDARFPAPHISLTGLAALPLILPGQTGQVHALFAPPLAEGALVAFDCDDVVVSDFKETAGRLDATVTVPQFHAPRTCSLSVHQPMSLRAETVPAFRIDGVYVWSLSLSNGMKARWTMKLDELGGRHVASQWQIGGRTEDRDVLIDRDASHFVARVDRSERDDEAATAFHDTPEEKRRAYQAEASALAAKVSACQKLPRDQMLACINQYVPQLQALLARQPSSDPNERVQRTHPSVCDELVLDVADGGKIAGVAQGCAGGANVSVAGTLTVAAP